MYVTLKAHFKSDAEVSLEILILHLVCIKFTIGKVDSRAQVIPNIKLKISDNSTECPILKFKLA